jgi:hypothetical protein
MYKRNRDAMNAIALRHMRGLNAPMSGAVISAWVIDAMMEVQSLTLDQKDPDPEPKAPPLGIKPRFIWLEERLDELLAAIKRKAAVGSECPDEWLEEMDAIIRLIAALKKPSRKMGKPET